MEIKTFKETQVKTLQFDSGICIAIWVRSMDPYKGTLSADRWVLHKIAANGTERIVVRPHDERTILW